MSNWATSVLPSRGKLEQVALDTLFITELGNKPRVQIEQALTDLGCIGNDWPDAKGTPAKPMEPVGRWPGVVINLLKPTADHAYSSAALEPFDDHCLQIGKDAVEIIGRRILSVELQLPDSGELDVFCFGKILV